MAINADKSKVVLTLAQKTIKRVAAGLESGEAAGLSEIVELIQQLSGKAINTSVQELAALIGKDVVVTAKVITAANTIGYNPNGVDVSTITQAIHVIGFNKIRQLAVSLLLIENAERTLNPSEKREIASLALCSGLLAEAIMDKHGTHTGEEAFICASLRNYGRLLMTTFMIEEYRAAKTMAGEGMSEDAAFEQVFGLTPLELGYHLLQSAHLPEPILKSLRALPANAIKKAAENPEIKLLTLADLAVKFCELALRPDLSAVDFERGAATLAARHGRVFELDSEGMLDVLKETGQHLTAFAKTFGLKSLAERLIPRLQDRVDGKDPVAARLFTPSPVEGEKEAAAEAMPVSESTESTAVPATTPSPSVPVEAAVTVPAPTAATPSPVAPAPEAAAVPPAESTAASDPQFQKAFEHGIEQMAGLLDENPVNMRKVYGVVLKAALQGFAPDETLILTRGRLGQPYAPEYGQGGLFKELTGKPLVREADRNVFGICLQRMEDVFIYDAADARISAHLPPWLKTAQLASFVLLPIHESRRPFAVLLAGWKEKKTMGFTVGQIRQVRSMLKLVGTARRLADAG